MLNPQLKAAKAGAMLRPLLLLKWADSDSAAMKDTNPPFRFL
jgi:hypothetical protein